MTCVRVDKGRDRSPIEGQREDLKRLLWQAAYVAPPRRKLWEPSLRAYVAGEIVMPEAVWKKIQFDLGLIFSRRRSKKNYSISPAI